MTLKKFLNSQVLKSIKDFKKKHSEIFDFAIYGSIIRGRTNVGDVDIAIIFSSPQKLEIKLNLSQKLRNELKKLTNLDLDIKGIDINDLSDKSFLAGKSIIAEGYLVIKKKFFCEFFGFNNYYIFNYSLTNLSMSKKVMLQYALHGRRGEKGIINDTKSSSIGKGVIKVPLESSEEFREFFEKNNINYKIHKCLLY